MSDIEQIRQELSEVKRRLKALEGAPIGEIFLARTKGVDFILTKREFIRLEMRPGNNSSLYIDYSKEGLIALIKVLRKVINETPW